MPAKFILFVFVNVICSWRYAIGGPTVVPADPFDAEKDAEIIWKAVKGWGTKEEDINKVLCKRPFAQRVQIATAFDAASHGDLSAKLQKETSGDLKKMYKRLMESRQAIMAIDLQKTINGKSKDYGAVSEIICGSDDQDKKLLSEYYMQNFNIDVAEDIKKYKVKDEALQKVLIEYCWRTYNVIPTLDPTRAQAAAKNIVSIDSKTDKDGFRTALQTVFQTYSLPDIQLILTSYRTLANKGINDAIKEAMKDEEAQAWTALALSTENRFKYYALLIHEAVDGFGTDEDRIYRIILTTCERFLGDIDQEYQSMQKESIYDRLSGLTGDFHLFSHTKDCVKKLLGK